ncbi:PEP-CTERM sorting domain-containing protein [Amantichitinum ursilacus]|uniref:PEP-CTERM motif protein n=1 Tax=Amantichitinum ursilacus TaxID=857265 RepID=A0A0N1JS27_9NEIS|nr:PEP-CTERM sorting domain-containing protein [Amantichitinum ursilacus]KPC50652.1 PEP-CTERM motif protein [Amantichitinum ursilacus]
MRALLLMLAAMACAPTTWAVVLYDSDAMTISYNLGPDSPTPVLITAAHGGTGNIVVNGVTREITREFAPFFQVALPDFSTGDHWTLSVDLTITAKNGFSLDFATYGAPLGMVPYDGSPLPSFVADQTHAYVGTSSSFYDFIDDSINMPSTDDGGNPVLIYRFFQAYQNPTGSLDQYAPSAITSVSWQSSYAWDKGGSSGTFVNAYGNLFGINATVSRLTPIPEPETWALLGCGVVGLLARRGYARRPSTA